MPLHEIFALLYENIFSFESGFMTLVDSEKRGTPGSTRSRRSVRRMKHLQRRQQSITRARLRSTDEVIEEMSQPTPAPPSTGAKRDTLSFSSTSSSESPLRPSHLRLTEEKGRPKMISEESSSTTQESPTQVIPNQATKSSRVSTSSLEEKARKLRERESLLEDLLTRTQAELREFQERLEDVENGYMAVRRCPDPMPTRKRIEVPEIPPSPIPDSGRKLKGHNSSNDVEKSFDEVDAHFTNVLKSTPRPPLAPLTNRQSFSSPPLLAPRPPTVTTHNK
jgi:hypothetical protein